MRVPQRITPPVVLVVEPQALPSMWLEDVLTDAGCAVSGPFATCDDALESLDAKRPSFAVVSVDLNCGPGFRLACALRRRDIPFALISGNARVPRAFADIPLFDRIFDGGDMVERVAARTSGCWGDARTCPMRERIAAGEPFALDQCPTACRD